MPHFLYTYCTRAAQSEPQSAWIREWGWSHVNTPTLFSLPLPVWWHHNTRISSTTRPWICVLELIEVFSCILWLSLSICPLCNRSSFSIFHVSSHNQVLLNLLFIYYMSRVSLIFLLTVEISLILMYSSFRSIHLRYTIRWLGNKRDFTIFSHIQCVDSLLVFFLDDSRSSASVEIGNIKCWPRVRLPEGNRLCFWRIRLLSRKCQSRVNELPLGGLLIS